MPILPQEIHIFPEDVLDNACDSANDERWWAAYTLARREKELMRRLMQMEIGFYCPLVPRRNRSPAGRIRISYQPLFSGYVFLRGTIDSRTQALTTQCISQTIPVADVQQFLHDLRQIQLLIDAGVPLTPERRIEPGQPVRVKSGPFLGLEGLVCKRHSGDRLIVVVQFLQQGASVAVEDFMVETI